MATSEWVFEKTSGRLAFKIGGSVVVSAKNSGWANGDSSGTSTDGTLTMSFDDTKSFWRLRFIHTGSTDDIFIDGQA